MSVTLRGGGSDQCDTLWQGERGQNWPKKRYVLVERPIKNQADFEAGMTNQRLLYNRER